MLPSRVGAARNPRQADGAGPAYVECAAGPGTDTEGSPGSLIPLRRPFSPLTFRVIFVTRSDGRVNAHNGWISRICFRELSIRPQYRGGLKLAAWGLARSRARPVSARWMICYRWPWPVRTAH